VTALSAQGFLLSEPLAVLDGAVDTYAIEVNEGVEEAYVPQSGVLAVAEPTTVNGKLRLKVLTLGSVESLMVKSTSSGQAVTYKPSNAVSVTEGLAGTKIWTLEGDFAPGNVLIAAKIDGDWGETAELVPVPALPVEAPADGAPAGESQGIVEETPAADGEPSALDGETPAAVDETPAGDETPAADETPAQETAAPAKKNFLQLLLEWLKGLFGIFQ
jgi:hypothetical protein